MHPPLLTVTSFGNMYTSSEISEALCACSYEMTDYTFWKKKKNE